MFYAQKFILAPQWRNFFYICPPPACFTEVLGLVNVQAACTFCISVDDADLLCKFIFFLGEIRRRSGKRFFRHECSIFVTSTVTQSVNNWRRKNNSNLIELYKQGLQKPPISFTIIRVFNGIMKYFTVYTGINWYRGNIVILVLNIRWTSCIFF